VWSWGRRGQQIEKVREQQVNGLIDMLGNGSDHRADGHGIMIFFQSGNQVEVEMVDDSIAGGFTQIVGDVDAMGVRPLAQNRAAGGKRGHKVQISLGIKFGEVTEVTFGGKKQMAVGVGKTIEQNHA